MKPQEILYSGMKKIALIPARYASTRFPYKLVQLLGDKPVIIHTYENTVGTGLFDEVIVVTDSEIINHEVASRGGKVMMSQKEHESGSDRIAEAAEYLDADIILNVQGDEPFVEKAPLEKLLNCFEGEEGKKVKVASIMQELKDEAAIKDPNVVKVVVDKNNYSLLFSRSVIPYLRDNNAPVKYYGHIGVYAFRRDTLLMFPKMEMTPLEIAEKIECLRFLENGIPLKMVETEYPGVKIDTKEDFEKAKEYYAKLNT